VVSILVGGGTQPGLIAAFLVAACLVILAGMKLSVYGDALGERTGLGSGLVGLLFIAGVTSLPELVVSTTSTVSASVRAAGVDADVAAALLGGGADLAVGNMLGSNVFNLMLLAVMDSVYRKGAITSQLGQQHLLGASGGLGILGILLFGLAWGRTNDLTVPGLGTGFITPVLLFAYLGIMALQGRLARRTGPADQAVVPPAKDRLLLKMPGWRFYGTLILLAGVIALSGVWLSVLGDRMSLPVEQGGFGLGQSFVGTFFLAVSTSLPELVICVSCVRLGSLDMAVGNVFGSNMFNLVIVFTADIGLRGGSILHHASLSHLVTVAMIIILTSIASTSLLYRSTRHFLKLGYDVWLMMAVYVLGNIAIYLTGA